MIGTVPIRIKEALLAVILPAKRKERASGQLSGSNYWSASRNGANNAWYFNGNNGYLTNNNFYNSNRALPVLNYSNSIWIQKHSYEITWDAAPTRGEAPTA